ncbi:unnamed protein product [Mytilus edulis]|uniref:Ig-like domain-containing protein n=1 Tax=Mytilus edulis TaxID=6550 RepID=A0A8S3RU94_MYTED|nr:unnamed protein product [Mytilus edulis]
MFEKICLICLFLQEQSILSDSTCSSITSYATEGSTINLTFNNEKYEYPGLRLFTRNKGERIFSSVNASKYDIKVHPPVTEFQIINVTASDKGYYWYRWRKLRGIELNITNRSCPSTSNNRICAIAGSSPKLKFRIDLHVYHGTSCTSEKKIARGVSKITIHAVIQIYNVTREDEGVYLLGSHLSDELTRLQLVKLWFINQTDLKTIVGQEGETLDIICFSDPEQYITELTLKSNGTVKAIGDNQTVSFSFIPYRTDHLTKFQCVDSNHSSIMIEVELSIRCSAVTVRYTNETIKCDCNGVPPIYSVYRLDRISKYEEIVRSVNLNNGTFVFKTDEFPYQRNGIYLCVVSNGIPGTNGKELQNSSIHVNYEGPPVFAKENRYVKIGKVRQSSVTMSFLVYSCPDVEEVFLEKLGRMRDEFDNKDGIEGYDILIESDELYIDDLQPYCITVTNRLGASEYYFAITKKEHNEINQKERTYVFTICILGVVLFSSIIVYVGVCVRRVNRRVIIHSNVNEDHTYHTYDEIGTISYGAVSNVRPSETHDNQGQTLAHQHEAYISNEVNVQSPDSNSTELNTDFPNEDLQQREVPGVQEQPMSLSMDDTASIDIKEQTSDRKSQTSNDSDSESSQTVMVGNVGDGYENPYQTVLLDRPEGNRYTQITIERNTSIVSADSDCEMQLLEHSLTKEAGYINLQF